MDFMMLEAMKTWRSLNAHLNLFTQAQCEEMLKYEQQHGKRWSFIERIHQRIVQLRAGAERDALAAIYKPKGEAKC